MQSVERSRQSEWGPEWENLLEQSESCWGRSSVSYLRVIHHLSGSVLGRVNWDESSGKNQSRIPRRSWRTRRHEAVEETCGSVQWEGRWRCMKRFEWCRTSIDLDLEVQLLLKVIPAQISSIIIAGCKTELETFYNQTSGRRWHLSDIEFLAILTQFNSISFQFSSQNNHISLITKVKFNHFIYHSGSASLMWFHNVS